MPATNDLAGDHHHLEGPIRPLVLRAIKVALVVGTCLTMINQGNLLLCGIVEHDMYWKVPLTFCVPFCVSLYSSIASTARSRRSGGGVEQSSSERLG